MSQRRSLISKILEQVGHFDAGEAFFLSRELLELEAKSYDVKYAPRTWEKFIPVDTSVDKGAEQTSYAMYDRTGAAKVGGNYAGDLPRVDVFVKEDKSNIVPITAAFGYNLQELRAAIKANRPLDTAKAQAARDSIEDQIDRIAWMGDAETGLTGLGNNANVLSTTVITGNWSTSATGDQILADLNKLVADVYSVSKQIWEADAIVMSPEDYMIVSQKPRATGSDRSVLEAFRAANPGIKSVGASWRLTTAGSGSSKRVIAMKKDPSVLQLVLPVRYETLPAQARNLEFVTPVHGRIGTVKVRYSHAIRYMDATG